MPMIFIHHDPNRARRVSLSEEVMDTANDFLSDIVDAVLDSYDIPLEDAIDAVLSVVETLVDEGRLPALSDEAGSDPEAEEDFVDAAEDLGLSAIVVASLDPDAPGE